MAFGAFIIGDEILVGKRQDKHLAFLIGALARRGLRLAWAQYLGDDPERLTAALKRSFASGDIVFSFGGIGATPDDHTRQCAAAAARVALRLHADAEREIRARFGGDATPPRLKMGEFPEGSRIIPNPVNLIPGFSLREHHFVPGFPEVKVFSLPSMGEDGSRIHVELGVRGNPVQVGDAIEALRHAVAEGGFPYK